MRTCQPVPEASAVVLRGQLAVCRSLLTEADSVLATLEPESTEESQRLQELRSEIAQAVELEPSGDKADLFYVATEGEAP